MTQDVYCGLRIKDNWPQFLRNGLCVTWEDIMLIARANDIRRKAFREEHGSEWVRIPLERSLNRVRSGVSYRQIGREYDVSSESVSRELRRVVREAAEEAQGLDCHTFTTLPWDEPEMKIRMKTRRYERARGT